jgi:hypothetical protein
MIGGLFFKVTDFEKIGVSGSTLPAPQRERIVWEAARDPVGLSVCRLSVVTDIDVVEVRRIVHRLHLEGLLTKKSRGHFWGWVSVDGGRARSRFEP